MRTIAIINQKGGCGKTTTAINLAGVFSRAGLRTLLVDLDPQSHCAAGLAIPEQRIDIQIGDAMTAGDTASVDWTRLLWRVSRNFDLAPSTVRLAGLESVRGGLASEPDGHQRLLSALSRLADQYDVCLIDCPPAIGLLTYNALVAASEVLIPVETAFFSLQGAGKQVSTIKSLAKRLAVAPPFRLLATMHNESSPLARDLLEELHRRFENKVIPVVVRFDPHLREAVSFGQPVVEYAPHSAGAEDYSNLGRWLIEHADENTPARPITAPARAERESSVTVMAGAGEAVLTRPLNPEPTLPQSPAAAPAAPAESSSTGLLSRAADLASRAQKLSNRIEEAKPRKDLPTLEKMLNPRATARVIEHTAQGLLGMRVTSQGVLFVQPAGAGSSLAIAGDFNGWSATSHPMRYNPQLNVFEACIPLPPGRFQYRLVVDGRWTPDPHNPHAEPNPFGDHNSVILVPSLEQALTA